MPTPLSILWLCGVGFLSWVVLRLSLAPHEWIILTGTLMVVFVAVCYYVHVLGRRNHEMLQAKCPWCKIPYTQHLTPEWDCLFRQRSSTDNTTNSDIENVNHTTADVNIEEQESKRAAVDTGQRSPAEKEEREDRRCGYFDPDQVVMDGCRATSATVEEPRRGEILPIGQNGVEMAKPLLEPSEVISTGTKLRRSARLSAKKPSPEKPTKHHH